MRNSFRNIRTKKLPGMTLIEVSIVLIIFGMIMATAVPFFTSLYHWEKQRRTETHREQICYALAGYVLKNARLPCASQPELGGKAMATDCQKDKKKCRGIVPYQELGIPSHVAKDGFGHWFTYGVEPNLTGTKKIGQSAFISVVEQASFVQIECDHIKIQGEQEQRKDVAFVLVSHGEEGGGSYLPHSSEKKDVFNFHEKINAQDGLVFYDGQSPGYTHSVLIMDRSFFISSYGKIPHGASSQIAQNNLESSKQEASPPQPSHSPSVYGPSDNAPSHSVPSSFVQEQVFGNMPGAPSQTPSSGDPTIIPSAQNNNSYAPRRLETKQSNMYKRGTTGKR